ncbi:ead/Ea22-like family protein [Salmonella enterica subsp. enterica]|nr:ead/Ea22-like family protein [Salmonella enterica]EED7663853.1 ead/Ea22-like family protein [Salmonella enterica subsp. enterica]
MSNIDKQVLRKAAEKADSGEWSYEEFNRMDLPGGAHININGRDAIYCLKKPVGGVEQSRAVTAFIAAFNPKVALALLDELEATAHSAAVDHEAACSLVEENETLKRRIVEQQRSLDHRKFLLLSADEVQRDFAEALECAGDNESIMEAIDDLKQHIAELEARAVNLPKRSVGEVMYLSGFSRDYAEGWCAGNDNAIHEIRTAGIKVKES